jgi:hypothetical protein
MAAYLDWLPSPASKAPPWLLRGWGLVFLQSVSLVLDTFVETARQGVRLRFPSDATPDALEALGEERQSPRATAYVYEVDDLYRARLRRLWDDRALAGGKTGLERMMTVLGFTSFQVYDQGEFKPSAPWNHAYIYLDKPHPWGPPRKFGDGFKFGDGTTFGSAAIASQVANVRAVLGPWIPSGMKCWLVLRLGDGEVFGGGWKWGDGTKFGGSSHCLWRLHQEDNA